MPPKAKVTGESILQAAVALVREKGVEALNARSLAAAIGCSTQPIFSNYESMEDLRDDVMGEAYHLYQGLLKEEMVRLDSLIMEVSGVDGVVKFEVMGG